MKEITVGTEKQIEWAYRIREDMGKQADQYVEKTLKELARMVEQGKRTQETYELSKTLFEKVARTVKVQTKAAWYIDRRETPMTIVFTQLSKLYPEMVEAVRTSIH